MKTIVVVATAVKVLINPVIEPAPLVVLSKETNEIRQEILQDKIVNSVHVRVDK